jgi:hypothetical protein
MFSAPPSRSASGVVITTFTGELYFGSRACAVGDPRDRAHRDSAATFSRQRVEKPIGQNRPVE